MIPVPFDTVSKETMKARRDICSTCQYNKVGMCVQCNCIIFAKTQLKAAKCPVNKWGPSEV